MENRTHNLSIRVSESLYKRFTDYLQANFLNGSAIMRDLLEKYLSERVLNSEV